MPRNTLACLLAALLMLAGAGIMFAATGTRAADQAALPQAQANDNRAAADQAIAEKLQREINGERNTQGNVYDYLTVSVKDGIATISGYARDNRARNEALDTARSARGVEGVVDNIEVLPVSPQDDAIRAEAARRIFSTADMGRYVLNPFHPIRIIVNGGHLILEGKVMSEMDRILAQTGANTTPGAYSVTNNLVVDPKLTGFEGH